MATPIRGLGPEFPERLEKPFSPDESPIELSIVAVVWNNFDVIVGMVESIFEQVAPETTEVIVVDNGSTDGTIEYLRERGDVIVIENGVNAGYPTAMNRGARRARGEFVMLANPDLIFRPGSLAAMVRELKNDPNLGGVSPVIEVPPEPGSVYPLLNCDPGIRYGVLHFSGLMQKFRGNRFLNRHIDFTPEETEGEIPWIHGCCGLFRRSALAPLGGGFDERFFIYFEDADLGRSLRKEGWTLRMAREARVLHLEDQTCKRIAVRSRRFFMESWHKYLRKHHALPYRACAWGAVTAALTLQLAVQCVKVPLRRAAYFPVIVEYAKHHLRAPFVDLDRERAKELDQIRAQFLPLPEELVRKPVVVDGSDEPEDEREGRLELA